MKRRQFLKKSVVAASVLAFTGKRALPASSDAYVEILADEPIGEISPLLYGHFTEHIGGVIYDGVWVGEKSKIRNYFGIRAELVDMLKKIHVPVIRWPGAASPIATTGAMASDPGPRSRGTPTSGRLIATPRGCMRKDHRSSSPMSSAPMSSCAFAS